MKNRPERKYFFPLIVVSVILLLSLACSVSARDDEAEPLPEDIATEAIAEAPTEAPLPTEAIPEPTEPDPEPDEPAEPDEPDEPTEASDLVVTSHKTIQDDDWLYIVGVVQNNTAVPMTDVEVKAALYDENDKAVDVVSIYPYRDVIPAGELSPFSTSSNEWSDMVTYELEVSGEEGELPALAPEISQQHTREDGDWLDIYGEIQNNSESPMSWVKISAALFDANGEILNTNYNYSMLDLIPPGGNSPFSMSMTSEWSGFTDYQLFIEADIEDEPFELQVEVVSVETREESEWCYAEGEVKNISDEPLDLVNVVAGFYDADGNIIDTGWDFAEANTLEPGATSEYSIVSTDCSGFESVIVQAED